MPFDYLSCSRKRAPRVLATLTAILCLLNYAVTIQMAQQQPDSPAARPELVLQLGHTGKVNAVAFSPDGKTLASSGDDRTIKLWDTRTGELKRTLIGHVAGVRMIVFSRDGKTLASDGDGSAVSCGTGDGSFGETIVWDARSWTVKRRLGNSQFGFFSMAVSPNIRTVAFSSSDYSTDTAMLDAATGKLQWKLEGIAGRLAFSPDGRTIAIAGSEGTVQLRDARTGAVTRTLTGVAGECSAVAFSPDGRILVRASGETFTVWNSLTDEINKTLQVGGDNILFSPDGKLATWSNPDGGNLTLKLWDTRTWQVKQALSRPNLRASSVAFSPDGRMLAIASADGAISLLRIRTGAMRMLTSSSQSLNPELGAGEGEEVKRSALSPDGLTAAMGNGNTVYLWNTHTGEMKQSLIGHRGFINAVTFSPDGKTMATGSRDNTVRLWDGQTGTLKLTLTVPPGSDQVGISFFPDGRTVAHVTSELMLLWDAQTGRRKPMLLEHMATMKGLTRTLGSFGFSPDGNVMATWSLDMVMLLDALTGKARTTIVADGEYVSQVVFTPDGKMLAAAQSCGLVTLWDAQTGAVRKKIELMEAFEDVLSVALSPDGKTGASGCSDNSVKVWDVLTGKVKATLKGHSDNVDWVAFLPDGKTLASGSYDNTLKIWEPNSGRLLATLMVLPPSKKGEANEWMAFTPEGYYTGSAGAARFIRWRVGDQLAPAATYESTFHRPDLVQKSLKGEQ